MLLQTSLSALALAAVSLAQGTDHIPVTGVPVSPNGPVPLRQNVDDLMTMGPQWDLYVQAMSALMQMESNNSLSFFQMAGIHGQPYIPWNNAGPQTGDTWLGYCPHGEDIFLAWHRPYVLLIEQTLVATAVNIANGYPAQYRQQYQQAANALRLPYWDWAAKSVVPQCTVPPTLKINVPNGSGLEQVDFTNPLMTFNFPQDALNGAYGPFNPQNDNHTIRCPAPQSYPDTANENLGSRTYKSWTYDVLTHSTDFTDFASTSGTGINVEQIHNAIHWDGACGNQFLAPQFSAFDPLFFMHHAQVDRLWAYWEAIMPNSTIFTEPYQGLSRFDTPTGTTITPDSPLEPFYQANGQFHTSASVQNFQGMGYSYQGMEYWEKSPAQMKSDVSTIINQLYGSGSAPSKRSLLDVDIGVNVTTRYFAQVSVNVTEIEERPCQINVVVCGKQAGSLVIMKLPATGIVNGGFTVDETIDTLLGGGELDVITGFQNSIEVEIKKLDGTSISTSSIPSLTIQLEVVNVTMPSSDDQLPTYGTSSHHAAYAVERGYGNLPQ